MKAFADKLVWMAILSLVLVVLVGAAGYILSPAGQVKAAHDIPGCANLASAYAQHELELLTAGGTLKAGNA
jgi:hypothetical protein